VAETLYLPSDTPALANQTDGVPTITTAVSVVVSVPGTISHCRFYATTGAASSVGSHYQIAAWEVTADDNTPAGTLLSSSALIPVASITPGAWNQFAFPAPIAVLPGHLYRIGMWNDAARYVFTANFYNGHDQVSTGGHMTAFHNGDNPTGLGTQNQNVFNISGGLTYPFNTTAANYWIDPVFNPAGSADQGSFLPFFD